jgi:hypothetical protein
MNVMKVLYNKINPKLMTNEFKSSLLCHDYLIYLVLGWAATEFVWNVGLRIWMKMSVEQSLEENWQGKKNHSKNV